MSKALIQLARVEEQMSSNSEIQRRVWTRLEEHGKRVHDLEIGSAKNMWIERLMWVAVSAAIAAGVGTVT